jgi:hypothetical protein
MEVCDSKRGAGEKKLHVAEGMNLVSKELSCAAVYQCV